MPFDGDNPLSARSHQTRTQQGRAGGGRAQGNAIQAQALSERFTVAESVLKSDGELHRPQDIPLTVPRRCSVCQALTRTSACLIPIHSRGSFVTWTSN